MRAKDWNEFNILYSLEPLGLTFPIISYLKSYLCLGFLYMAAATESYLL